MSSQVRYPVVKIDDFDGTFAKFRQWSDYFDQTVHKNDRIPVVMKFNMLRQSLKGEAKKCIEHFTFAADSYEPARSALKRRFGQDAMILGDVVSTMTAYTPKGFSASECRETLDAMQGHLQTLRTVGAEVDTGTSAGTYIAVILPKLKHDYRKTWHKHVQEKYPNGFPPLTEFFSVIGREIDADRKASTSTAKGSTERERHKDRPYKATALATQKPAGGKKGSRPQGVKKTSRKPERTKSTEPQEPKKGLPPPGCGICGTLASSQNRHDAADCPEGRRLSPKERGDRVRAARACFSCLNQGHMVSTCPRRLERCDIGGCTGRHHPLIHQ